MATKSNDNDKWVSRQSTTGGLGGTTQDLNTGLVHGPDGEVLIPEIRVPDGETIVQSGMVGAFRRTVFSNGAVETVQVEPANQGDGGIQTPVPLPGESQDVTGTGQDAAYKPKVMSGNAPKADSKK